ncbi:MAG: Gfo/Idh/MocA family oxidoreductase, partial [Chloroflexi bacterium]|nr:Gfo/Idh/MocA family oxidoreductase [Chloroflexota bacterium]
ANLVAVSDANAATAEAIGKTFGAAAYSDYRELLEKEKPEAVSVAVPTAMHEQVVTDVLNSGANVLVEKPIAATIEEGQRLIALAKQKNLKLQVGHIVRFNPAIQELKKRLNAGELGRIYQVFCRRAGPFPARIRDVGVVIDLAPHDVDIIRFLTGLDPIRLFAETEQRIHTEHEDLLWGMLRLPDGITASVEINWLTPTKIREVLVLGERGLFRVDDLTQDLYFYENAQATGLAWDSLKNLRGVSEGGMVRFAFQRFEPLKAELQGFLKAVAENTPVPVSGEDGLAALKIALALVESGKTHQVINF